MFEHTNVSVLYPNFYHWKVAFRNRMAPMFRDTGRATAR